MKKIIIRLNSLAPREGRWVEIDAEGRMAAAAGGDLAELAAMVDGHRVIALVPGEEVLLTSVSLPRGNRKRLMEAVPYALEESLAIEVEDQHFALGAGRKGEAQAVAVITRKRLEYWLALLKEAGIEPAFVTSEVLAVPCQPSRRGILLDGDLALVRSGPQAGFALEVESLPLLLAAGDEAEQEAPPDLLLYYNRMNPAQASLPPEIRALVAEEKAIDEPLLLLAEGFDEKTAINLRQGVYSPVAQWERQWRRWRLPAALVLAVLLLQFGVQIREYYRLRTHSSLLSVQIQQVFRQTFPDARRIVNPRAQMEHHLQSLQRSGDAGSSGLLALMDRAGASLLAAGDFTLKGLRYREGELDLDFEIRDLRELDNLKDGLAGQGLTVDIRTATARGDRVQARLQIREKRS
jgi:general secretion pathway protein L